VAALLDPAVEVGCGDGVGRGEQWVGGFEEFDGGGFVDDAFARPIESGSGREVAGLVLDDERATVADKGIEPGLGGGEFRTRRIGADSDHQQIPGREIGRG